LAVIHKLVMLPNRPLRKPMYNKREFNTKSICWVRPFIRFLAVSC